MANKRLVSLLSATTSFALVILSGMLGANAVSINYQNNDSSTRIATGIDNLEVEGQKYNVEFIYDTFANVFGNASQSGFTPPNFSGSRRQIRQGSIRRANNAIKKELNRGQNRNRNVTEVVDANSGQTKEYFVTGGFVNRNQDTVKVFFGEWNSIDNKWESKDVTCNYDIANNPLSGQPKCGQTLASFGITFNSSSLQAIQNNPTNYFFTQPKVMFAKSTPVPEPITILGTVVAGGMGIAIKRKQKNKTAA